jgi:hypothetical protein
MSMNDEPLATEATPPENVAECGTCGFRWDDTKSTDLTPAPAGRCPNEYNHPDLDARTAVELEQLRDLVAESALDQLEEFARLQADTPGGQKHAIYLAAIVRGALREGK